MMPRLHEFLSQWGLTVHGLVTLAGLVVYVIASHTRRQRRHPSAAIAWVVSLALMPYLALPLYLLIGSRKVTRGPLLRDTPALPVNGPPSSAPSYRFQQLAAAMGLAQAAAYEQLAIHQDGKEALAALRSVLLEARQTLDICTFLLGRDALGREVSELLMQQARSGVRVRLLVDGIGVYLGGRPDLKPLSAAGVHVALFVSPFRSPLPGRTNLRNHRKMVMADGQRMWSGGRNLAAEYFVGDASSQPQKVPWIDLSFDFRGDLARQAQQRFDQDWDFATQAVPAARPLPALAGPACGVAGAQLIASGPDQAEDTLYSLLIASCFTARSRILLITPYFVPDATLLMALTLAARRGVAVDLILPRRSNHRLADLARPAALREMAAAGARVWLVDGMVHAKAVVIDTELALAGSANLDERSLFLNYELMMAFFRPADVHRFACWIEQQRAAARLYRAKTPSPMVEFSEGLIRWLAFQL
ncbi:phosphatidylserine/phosphatidylglycerophosphate/cardiolipin synthase family protein [Polaromonas sp. CG_9.11]|uniref:phospholipase D-like domain-containing protein n=1 Tax=Polaromonas sp. CG_9.11 TaxID=2787730 RepID=UPI001A1E8978|nr:phospholipase D-like domain-containing protein [Polaromonas sp. CG_9.11]MBG6074721.1 cardiolipin synthase [Polaromonas sp. CG_9.11]